MTEVAVLALIKSQTDQQSKGVCHTCGKPSHWSRECPDKKSKGPSNRGRSGTTQQGRSARGGPKSKNNLKTTPPASGEPQSQLRNGKMMHWCATCGRWSTTHGTSTHVGKQGQSGLAVNFTEVHDPPAWHCDLEQAPALNDCWMHFGPSAVAAYHRRLHLGILGAIPYDSINVLCLEYLVFATSGSLVGVVCRGGVGLPWCDPVY
jgi:Zinc knuckle